MTSRDEQKGSIRDGAYMVLSPKALPMPTAYIEQTRRQYDSLGYPPYQWFEAEDAPVLTKMSKPLSESKLGLISTAGTYVAGQQAYYYKDDASIREIPSNTDMSDLRFAHIMENYLVEAWQDPGVVFPIEALRKLNEDGTVGELAEEFLACMGGIYSQRRVNEELIPQLEAAVDRQQLDLLLLVPL